MPTSHNLPAIWHWRRFPIGQSLQELSYQVHTAETLAQVLDSSYCYCGRLCGSSCGSHASLWELHSDHTGILDIFECISMGLVCSCVNALIKLAQVIITTEVCPHQNHHLDQSQNDSRESKIKRMKFVRVIPSLITVKERRQLFNNDI